MSNLNRIIYLSSDSVGSAIGESQVVDYLELDVFLGRTALLSIETLCSPSKLPSVQVRRKLESIGVVWTPIIRIRTSRTLVNWATLSIALARLMALLIGTAKEGVDVIHCRSYLAMAVALGARELGFIRKCKIIFDTRGFWFDEKFEQGRIHRTIYVLGKKLESYFFRRADVIICLTYEAKKYLESTFPLSNNVRVIPTCLKLAPPSMMFAKLPLRSRETFRILWSGSVTGHYQFERALFFLSEIKSLGTKIHFTVFTEQITDAQNMLKCYNDLENITEIRTLSRRDCLEAIFEFDYGIYFLSPTPSKIASSPTKTAEFLVASVPIITNRGIGDIDGIFAEHEIGLIVDDLSDDSLRSAAAGLVLPVTEKLRENCLRAFNKYFELDIANKELNRIYASFF